MKKSRCTAIMLIIALFMSMFYSVAFAADTPTVPAAPNGAMPGGGMGAPGAPTLESKNTSKYFTDLNSSTAAYNAYIDALYEKGLVNGTSNGIYSPSKSVTRADFILTLYRNFKYADSKDNFSDVPSTAYYAKAAAAAKKAGIVTGTTFNPKGILSREDAAVILFAAMKADGMPSDMATTDLSAYKDAADVSQSAASAVGTLTRMGFFKADSNGCFLPKASISRAEMAVLVYQAVSMKGPGGAPNGAPGGNNGSAPGGNTSGGPSGAPTGGGAHSTAAVYVSGGARNSANEYTDAKVAVDKPSNINGKTAGGIMLSSNDYNATGIVVSDGSYTFGGNDDIYTVYSDPEKGYIGTNVTGGSNKIGSFNSVLLFGLDKAVEANATQGSSGIEVKNNASLNINNAYMQVDGSQRYVASNYGNGTMIVNDSYLVSTGNANGKTGKINVPFSNEALLISGSARTNFSIGATKTYYYNSTVIADGWAALSTDSASGNGLDLYAYNTTAKALNGGYGTYADTNCRVWLYGSILNSAEVGGIISKNGQITVSDGASAGSSVTQYNTGKKTAEGTIVTGGRNAIMMHAPDMMNAGLSAADCGTLNVSNSTLATSKDLVSTYDYSSYSKAVKAYVDYISGDDILIKSTSANINLDKAIMSSYNGVLIHSLLNSDSMGNFLKAGDNTSVKPISVSMSNMSVKGNILHEDYQRNMSINLTKTTLEGDIVQGTYESWKALWSGKGITAANWLPDKSWSGSNSLSVTVGSGSTWTIAQKSTVSSLTIKEGAAIQAPTGKKLTMTVNGVEKAITAGTYSGNIVLTVK